MGDYSKALNFKGRGSTVLTFIPPCGDTSVASYLRAILRSVSRNLTATIWTLELLK